jgi:hypothetical protein
MKSGEQSGHVLSSQFNDEEMAVTISANDSGRPHVL